MYLLLKRGRDLLIICCLKILVMCNKVKIKEEKRCMNTEREIEKNDEKFSLIDVMNESVQNIDLYAPLNLNSQNRA